jgi:hypothetical protein
MFPTAAGLFDRLPRYLRRHKLMKVWMGLTGEEPAHLVRIRDDAQLGRIDFVKLNVEGYELSALRGAERALRNGTIKAVYFEYFEKYLVRVAPPSFDSIP